VYAPTVNKKMAALKKELEELREQLISKEELIDILIKEKDALKMRLEYEKKKQEKRSQLPFCDTEGRVNKFLSIRA
jgi:hypothetical protein